MEIVKNILFAVEKVLMNLVLPFLRFSNIKIKSLSSVDSKSYGQI